MSGPVTADALRKCHMRESLHGHGKHGMWVYEYTCIEYPRLVKRERCPKRGAHVDVTFIVDGREVGSDLLAAVVALNRPHDLAGCSQRLSIKLVDRCQVELIDGRLLVRGETASRCERLAKSFLEFEGIPIVWVPPDVPVPEREAPGVIEGEVKS